MAKTTNEVGPQYYRRGSIQVWSFIRDQGLNFHLGNVIKYVCRAGYKGNDIEDLKKAIHYLQNEVEFRTSERVQVSFQREEQQDTELPDYATQFDR